MAEDGEAVRWSFGSRLFALWGVISAVLVGCCALSLAYYGSLLTFYYRSCWSGAELIARPAGLLAAVMLALWYGVNRAASIIRQIKSGPASHLLRSAALDMAASILALAVAVVVAFMVLFARETQRLNFSRLMEVQHELDEYHAAHKDVFPTNLNLLNAAQPHLPELWEGGGWVSPHPRNHVLTYVSKRNEGDSGGWAYVNDASSKDFGAIYINCTHTDYKGKIWNSY